jgi:hypothetical protein
MNMMRLLRGRRRRWRKEDFEIGTGIAPPNP